MVLDLYQKALDSSRCGKKYAFATIIESTIKGTPRKSGAKMIVFEDGTSFGTIGGGRNEKAAIQECLKSIKINQPILVNYDYFGQVGQSICGGQIKVFIEPVMLKKTFIICGAGHIALPLSMLAKMLNFNVQVIDNRRQFANKNRFPHADKIFTGDYVKNLSKCNIDSDAFIMIVTQGNEFDYQCLKTVIKSSASYIGVISSKAKRIKFFKRLKNEEKIKESDLKRINIPAGLDLGAQTPEEIAVSICAEVVKILNINRLGTEKFKR